MFQRLIKHIIYTFSVMLISQAFALPSDNQKPYYFESKSVLFNNKKHEVRYLGNVTLHQGTTQLKGDKLIIHLTEKNKITDLTDYGKPASYSTIQNSAQGRIYAYADTIFYDALKKTVTLTGHAKAIQKANKIQAAKIIYNMQAGTIRTSGNAKEPTTHIAIMPQTRLKYGQHSSTGKLPI